jgi:oxaloacetate decarboxylase alpha subunit
VLDEAGRVRAEFGYPIMVTPLAQFVGSQAAVNIITGERYKEVTDQAIQYALGLWGKEAPQVMAADIKDKILSHPRAREWAKWTPPNLSLKEVRRKYGGPGVSDEEIVLRVIAGRTAVDEMIAAGAPKQYTRWSQPLVSLIDELSRKQKLAQVYIRKGDFSLAMKTSYQRRR